MLWIVGLPVRAEVPDQITEQNQQADLDAENIRVEEDLTYAAHRYPFPKVVHATISETAFGGRQLIPPFLRFR